MSLQLLYDIYASLLGLVVGSYLNVLIYRVPRGISTVLPRSRCPACGTRVAPWDNIPVLSYLLLRGRCRSCGAPISPRYPLVEASTAALFVVCVELFPVVVPALAACTFCALLLALALIDAEHFLLPDVITLPGIVAGLAFSSWVPWTDLPGAALGALLGGGVLLALWGLWYLLRGEEGMGLGDVKMLAMIGAFLGWPGMLVSLFAGALTGAVAGVVLIWIGKGGMKTRLPFGTFLAFGALVALFAGPAIVRYYGGLF